VGPRETHAGALALGAVALWASVAALGVELARVPPFLLTGASLLIGSLIALPMSVRGGRLDVRRLRAPLPALAVGVTGLFGYHFLLFMALRIAPPVEANLVNYLWPLLIVLLAPVVLPGVRMRGRHAGAALAGFGGAALAIGGGGAGGGPGVATPDLRGDDQAWVGYLCALGGALVWALYSLTTKRLSGVPTTALGSVLFVSGLLALGCHLLLEPPMALSASEVALLVVMGIGPLGAAFFLWDAALKRGEAATIGLLSFITPVLSTSILLLMRGELPGLHVVAAAVIIVGAAVLGTRGLGRDREHPG
jgi:drug/metabolite transporter (DMT)-like permease